MKSYLISFLKSLEVISRNLQAQRDCAIQEYENMEDNALITYHMSDATNATTATIKQGQE